MSRSPRGGPPPGEELRASTTPRLGSTRSAACCAAARAAKDPAATSPPRARRARPVWPRLRVSSAPAGLAPPRSPGPCPPRSALSWLTFCSIATLMSSSTVAAGISAEISAYAETFGCHDSHKFPFRPEFPRSFRTCVVKGVLVLCGSTGYARFRAATREAAGRLRTAGRRLVVCGRREAAGRLRDG
jgi:hypothetical protein